MIAFLMKENKVNERKFYKQQTLELINVFFSL